MTTNHKEAATEDELRAKLEALADQWEERSVANEAEVRKSDEDMDWSGYEDDLRLEAEVSRIHARQLRELLSAPLVADALAVLGQDQAAKEDEAALTLEDPECLFVGGPFGGQTQRCRVVSAIPMLDRGGIYWLDTKSDPPTYHWQAK